VGKSRWLAPAVAALAVLVVVLGTWTFVGPGDGPRAAHPSPAPLLPTPADGALIGGPPRMPVPSPSHPPLTNPRGVAVDRYSVLDPTHLLVSYTIGVTDCYGVIRRPLVQESASAVTVTLTRKTMPTGGGAACPNIALMEAVRVTLRAPLGGRVVLDGATGGTPVVRGPRLG